MTAKQTQTNGAAKEAPHEAPPRKPDDPGTSTRKRVQQVLEDKAPEIAKLCGKYLTADRLFKVSLNAFAKNPKLLECTAASLVQSIVTCAEWGLEPNTASAHCYLKPYNCKVKKLNDRGQWTEEWQKLCQAELGYRGMIELFRRSGLGQRVMADVVREGDLFRLRHRTGPDGRFITDFEHDLTSAREEKSDVVAAYAIGFFESGAWQVVKLERWEIDKIHDVSQAEKGPWDSWFEEMAKKSAVRRLMKYLPTTPDLDEKLSRDDQVVDGTLLGRSDHPSNAVHAPPPPARAALPSNTGSQSYESFFGSNGAAAPEPEPVEAPRAEAPPPRKRIAPPPKPPEPEPEPETAHFEHVDVENSAEEEREPGSDDVDEAPSLPPPPPPKPSWPPELDPKDDAFSDKLLGLISEAKTRKQLRLTVPLIEMAPPETQAAISTAFLKRQKALPKDGES